MALDWALYEHGTPASQFLSMLADFVPESIALGAVCAVGGEHVILLAALIGLQNVPEGFNAYRELRQSEAFGARKIILMFALMALLGPLAGAAGYLWLSGYPQVVSAVMLLATCGILYSVFQDIAPQAKMCRRWALAMGHGRHSGLLGGYGGANDGDLVALSVPHAAAQSSGAEKSEKKAARLSGLWRERVRSTR
jgi:ZIP family zinc transporter